MAVHCLSIELSLVGISQKHVNIKQLFNSYSKFSNDISVEEVYNQNSTGNQIVKTTKQFQAN